jgi:pyruvate,water dikinase
MVGQWLLTDNRRLRIAKQRAGRLRKLAADLPEDSPRRKTMLQLARPVQARVVKAALVPLAVVLGPMVLSFLWWFPARVDPASWNPEPGTTAFVVATVDGEFTGPVTMELDEALELVDAESASQRLTPIRDVLERRLGEWQKESNYKDLPWELREVGQWARGDLLADLTAYLKDRLPPRTLAWSVRTPGEAGRFTVTLSYPGGQPVAADLVLGDAFAPPPREDLGDGKAVGVFRPSDPESKIQSVAVRYEQKPPGKFYTPFAAVGSSWDVGWLLLYVAVYLPVMLACRWVLRVP